MDRRKRTGVALAAGLLFLFVTEILLLFLAREFKNLMEQNILA